MGPTGLCDRLTRTPHGTIGTFHSTSPQLLNFPTSQLLNFSTSHSLTHSPTAVERLLAEDASIAGRDKLRRTPLIVAIICRNADAGKNEKNEI